MGPRSRASPWAVPPPAVPGAPEAVPEAPASGRRHDPPAQADRPARRVPDREDDPLAEPVVRAAARRARRGEAHLRELVRPDVPSGLQRPAHRVPAAGRVAELERLDRRVREAAAAQVVERGLPRPVLQDHVVEGDRRLQDLAQARVLRVLAARAVVELHPGLAGEEPERLGERDAVPAHDEAEDVPSLATAEAVPRLAGGRDDEGRRLLTVERAQALEGGAGLLQLHGLADDLDDREPVLHFSGDADGQPISRTPLAGARPTRRRRAGRRRPRPPREATWPIAEAGHLRVPEMARGVSRLDTPSRTDSAPGGPRLSRGLSIPQGGMRGQGAVALLQGVIRVTSPMSLDKQPGNDEGERILCGRVRMGVRLPNSGGRRVQSARGRRGSAEWRAARYQRSGPCGLQPSR